VVIFHSEQNLIDSSRRKRSYPLKINSLYIFISFFLHFYQTHQELLNQLELKMLRFVNSFLWLVCNIYGHLPRRKKNQL
jgi:hypothetical protein